MKKTSKLYFFKVQKHQRGNAKTKINKDCYDLGGLRRIRNDKSEKQANFFKMCCPLTRVTQHLFQRNTSSSLCGLAPLISGGLREREPFLLPFWTKNLSISILFRACVPRHSPLREDKVATELPIRLVASSLPSLNLFSFSKERCQNMTGGKYCGLIYISVWPEGKQLTVNFRFKNN